MGDIHGESGFSTNVDRFLDRRDQPDCVRTLVAEMGVVHAAVSRGDLGELDHFRRGRVALWVVEESGRHSNGAVPHGLVD